MSVTANSNEPVRNWFALYTRPKSEFKAEQQLEAVGVNHYLPVITQLRQWSDRKKKVTEPLLRGYIFVYVTEKERLTALEQPSVIRCVCERGKPAVIPENQMNNLKAFIQKEKQYEVYNGLIPGTKVKIMTGPFKGVEGIVQNSGNGKQLSVTVELLNRTILTYIAEEEMLEVVQNVKN